MNHTRDAEQVIQSDSEVDKFKHLEKLRKSDLIEEYKALYAERLKAETRGHFFRVKCNAHIERIDELDQLLNSLAFQSKELETTIQSLGVGMLGVDLDQQPKGSEQDFQMNRCFRLIHKKAKEIHIALKKEV